MTMAKRVTITDLAKELGLAKSAVSYALNDQPGVSPETRSRVKALATERGWRPSSVARALSGSRAGAIGIVLGREPRLLADEPWYQLVIAGVEEVLIDADISLMLRMVGTKDGRANRTYRQWSEERRVDGVLVFDGIERDKRLPLLRELELPSVLIGFRSPGFSSVTADSASEAELLVQHVAERGASSVLHLGGPRQLSHERRRRDGVRTACEARGLTFLASDGNYTLEGGRVAADQALRELQPDAVVCSNDLMALGTLSAAADLGLEVPGDVKVTSWDYSTLTRSTRPTLTALDRDALEFGRRGARLLLDQIEGEQALTNVVLPARLVSQSST